MVIRIHAHLIGPEDLSVFLGGAALDARIGLRQPAFDFVRILLFEDFTQVVNTKELSQTPAPPPTPGSGGEVLKPQAAAETPAAAPAPKAPVGPADATTSTAAQPRAKPPATKPAGPAAATAAKSSAAKPKAVNEAAPATRPPTDKKAGAPAATAGAAKPKIKPPPNPSAEAPHQ